MLTDAPCSTAPLESVTTPCSEVVDWANTRAPCKHDNRRTKATGRMRRNICAPWGLTISLGGMTGGRRTRPSAHQDSPHWDGLLLCPSTSSKFKCNDLKEASLRKRTFTPVSVKFSLAAHNCRGKQRSSVGRCHFEFCQPINGRSCQQ